MIQRFLAWGLSTTMHWVDDSVAEEDLHAFVREKLHEMTEWVHTGKIHPDDHDVRGIISAVERLRVLGVSWLSQFDLTLIPHDTHDEDIPDTIAEVSPPAVHQGCITWGVADSLLGGIRRDESMSPWQQEQMEALLRHIEVRRQAGLRFQPSMPGCERWMEIQRLSLLFTRHAEQRQDFRFLNTALKLNDWSYKHYRTSRLTPSLLGYLRAVLEAEAILIEMTS